MVDFGDTLFDTNLGSAVPIVQPVADKSSEYFAQGLKSGIDGMGAFLALDAKNKTEAANSALNQDIVEKMSLLADARDQGKMTISQANRQLRVWSNEWVSNFPDQTDSIFTLVNKLGGDRAIAGSIYTETPQEKGRRESLEAGAKAGWDVSTPEGVNNWDAFQAHARQLEIQTQELQHLQNSNQIISETQKANYTQQFQVTAASAFPWVQSKITQTNTLLQSVSDPTQRQAIIDKMKNEVAVQTGMLSTFGGLAGAEKLDYLIKPINDLVTQFEETATGKSTQTALETAIAQKNAQFKLLMYSDPKWGNLFMMNETVKFTAPESLAALDKASMELVARLGVGVQRDDQGNFVSQDEKGPDVVDKVENLAVGLDTEKQTVTNMLKQTNLTPEQTGAMNDRMAVLLNSVTKNGSAENDATNFNAVVNYMADTSVGQWMEKNYNAIGPKIASDAAVVVERQYSDVVLNLVNERWADVGNQLLRGGAVGPDGSPMDISKDLTKLVEPVWNGYGIEFKVNDQFKNDAALQGIARELNQGKNSVTGPVNRLIRMAAHLSGTTDYEKVYNEEFKNRLWVKGNNETSPENVQMTQAGQQMKTSPQLIDRPSDLQLEDFDTVEIEQIIKDSKAANPGAMLMASNPTDIAQAYLGANENDNEQAAAISAFIKRNAGIDINPATTAWCAAFLDAVLHASGSQGTGKLNARSYLAWGVPVDNPQLGDVVVLQRGGKDSWQGHVGLYMGTNDNGSVRVLGGNTGDKVGEADYAPEKVLGFRRAG